MSEIRPARPDESSALPPRCRVLAVPSAIIPPAIIGVLRPLSGLADVDVRLELPDTCTPDDVAWADVVVFSRNNDIRTLTVLAEAQRRGIPTVYEIDDDFFDVPESIPALAALRHPGSLRSALQLIRGVTRVHTYSTLMAERIAALGADVRRAPVYFDTALVDSVPRRSSDLEPIVFATGRTDEPELDRLVDDLIGALLRRRPAVEIHIWRAASAWSGERRVVQHAPKQNYAGFLGEMASLGALVGLAPLSDDLFYRAKTNNKYREYAGSRIPGVYSDVKVYRESVQDGRTGLLVPNDPAAWVAAVERLLDDRTLRDTLAAAAYDDVRTNYRPEASSAFWAATLAELTTQPPAPRPVARPVDRVVLAQSSDTVSLRRRLHVMAAVRSVLGVVSLGAPKRDDVGLVRVLTSEDVHAVRRRGGEHLVVDVSAAMPPVVALALTALGQDHVALVDAATPLTVEVSADSVTAHPWLPEQLAVARGRVLLVEGHDIPGAGVRSWGCALANAVELLSSDGSSSHSPPGRLRWIERPEHALLLVSSLRRVAIGYGRLGARSLRQPLAMTSASVRHRLGRRTTVDKWNEVGFRDV